LQEFKLSSNVYLERFNTCRKDADETYVAFASRIKGLLDYYLESRRVDNFEKLCDFGFLGPTNIPGTIQARNFKFGTERDCSEY